MAISKLTIGHNTLVLIYLAKIGVFLVFAATMVHAISGTTTVGTVLETRAISGGSQEAVAGDAVYTAISHIALLALGLVFGLCYSPTSPTRGHSGEHRHEKTVLTTRNA